ncbi:hypothetical protein [Actinomadura macra]|uniref:hypothetical protein n=1 Tax=Actinomadura macra TaxID=46164 RepID=UPI0008305B4A|nr:hypothetical protein [Actinomadura macra]
MNHFPRGPEQSEATRDCLLYELSDLVDVTAKMDGAPRDRYRFVEELVTVAYRVAAAAEPLLEGEVALITALREAAASRQPIRESCPDFEKVDGGRCGHHAGGLTVAETYHELGRAISGPGYISP